MKNKNFFRLLILAAIAAMIVNVPLPAAPGCQKHGHQEKIMAKDCQMDHGCMTLKQIPNLSAEQKAKLETLHAEHLKLMAAARVDMEKLAGEMQALMKDPVDVKAVEVKIDEMAKMHAGLQKKCLAHHQAMQALLTAEQKAKLGGMGCGMGSCMMGGWKMRGQGCMMGGKGCLRHGQEKAECQKKTTEEKK